MRYMCNRESEKLGSICSFIENSLCVCVCVCVCKWGTGVDD